MQGALLFEGAKIEEYRTFTCLTLDKDNAGWLLAAPGMSMLTAISDPLRQQIIRQSVGMRHAEHRNHAIERLRPWQGYENMERDVIPSDAVAANQNPAILGYYIPDLTIVDLQGLTDATIARNPISTPNDQRQMAHDRDPPPGYLDKRGINFFVYPALSGKKVNGFARHYIGPANFKVVKYAVKVGPDLWLAGIFLDRQWHIERFAERELRIWYPSPPPGNRPASSRGPR